MRSARANNWSSSAGHVGALHVETFARAVQRFQVSGQLLAQLRVLGVHARDCNVAFDIGNAGTFGEFFDASLGSGQRLTPLFDERRMRAAA